MNPTDSPSRSNPVADHTLKACRCARCGSDRLHHSHRRGPIEQILYIFGTQIRRCHACRLRQAWFQFGWTTPISIRLADDSKRHGWSGAALLCGGFVVCVGFLWWMITRFSALPG
jgi:hypothetical protein